MEENLNNYVINQVNNKYRTPNSTQKREVNAIYLNPANTYIHEMAKCKVCYSLLKEGKKFITEAVNPETGERHDIICLTTNEIIEIVHTNTKKEVLEHYKKNKYKVIFCDLIEKLTV